MKWFKKQCSLRIPDRPHACASKNNSNLSKYRMHPKSKMENDNPRQFDQV